ncbi:7SK snRNA methylphosphate capping enzyme [Oryzias melastigma]|uniref:RNA methyltransferase n=1 Tax=Oryzias melastigma TaxID=30732 RepID=A0A834CBI5_ORYME|nr:7SK snRNA methylphosphate capping enzyme [Oryzias melastigma]
MSVKEDAIKTGSLEARSTPSLQLSDCTGGYSGVSVTMEENAAAHDFAAACPVPGTAASPKHTSTDSAGQKARGTENSINRRNSFHHSKQQQQQSKLTKRRYTANSSFKHPTSSKRRRRANSESDSVLAHQLSLGLLDEEVNRALNAETPKSSPLPAKSRDPVEILIPRDITDPLNLNSGIADNCFLVSPYKSGGRKRHRNRHHGGGGGGVSGGIPTTNANISESTKSEIKMSSSVQVLGTQGSCSALDSSKESSSFSSVTADSHESTAENASSCKDEPSFGSVEEYTCPLLGGPSHHAGRRRRRRNSGKIDPPVTHSTPSGKVAPSDKSCATGGAQNYFHTPRIGPKTGAGPRPYQQPHGQAKGHQKKFQYGNYNKYYGYRNPGKSEDPRIRVLRPEWFEGKDVLDLGCNSGHLTLYIAKMLRPARILGLDIDGTTCRSCKPRRPDKLLNRRKAVIKESHTGTGEKHRETERREEHCKAERGQRGTAEAESDNGFCHTDDVGTQRQDGQTEETERGDCEKHSTDQSVSCSFPVSLRISRGPIAAPPLTEKPALQPGQFPANVSFVKANYVLENDNLLLTQRPEYDVILCLSVTKWVHLNWGDSGLKRLFRRVYKHLRPGGVFILEPQPWESYVRRKKLTENINRNFHSIRLKPDQFASYLTSEVGFTSFESLQAPKCSARDSVVQTDRMVR